MPHRFKIFFKRKSYYIANSQNLTNSMDGHSKGVIKVLDTIFQGQYLPSVSINYVTINKVLEKLPPQLY